MHILLRSIYQTHNLLFYSGHSFFTSMPTLENFELTRWQTLNYFMYLVGLHQIKNYYTQTCSNNHLYKMTTCLRQPMLSPPKPIPIQSLMNKATTCLAQPVTTYFVFQMKKTCLKQPLQNFTQ